VDEGAGGADSVSKCRAIHVDLGSTSNPSNSRELELGNADNEPDQIRLRANCGEYALIGIRATGQ